ncbi:MAG: sporulation transcriptional regulator SpoIIID [Tenericutes bacterium]|nr:sporulation transcriptional regulator SpoIIID [Mycoplasmatota bacterium]
MEEKIKYEAEYILYSKNKTLEEISDELNISKRTLQNHINTLLPEIDKKLYEKVRIKIDETSKLRNIKGGQTGKKHSSYTQEEIEYLCNEFTKAFNNNNKEEIMSLREFAEKYSIPKSTLYDILTKYVTDNDLSMIKSLFEFNKRHK